MVTENETWIIETGDVVINKMADSGESSLSKIEHSIYCFWVVDYAIRNSGALYPMEDIYPNALVELNQFAEENNCNNLSLLSDLSMMNDEEIFRDNFYNYFEPACDEIRNLYESH